MAVRSSGAREDLETASFAGIYESHLGVCTPGDFWEKTRRCWLSAWSPRAVQYACKMGIPLPADHMAVLVQRMLPAGSAGVIFTADPLTGNPFRFVLNAVFGLAQGLDAAVRLRRESEEKARAWFRQHDPASCGRFEKLPGWTQFWSPALDDRKWHAPMTLRLAPLLRKTGELFAAQKAIPTPDDIRLLSIDDLKRYVLTRDAGALTQACERNREDVRRNRRLNPPACLGQPPVISTAPETASKTTSSTTLGATPVEPAGGDVAAGRVFHGQGYSPGRVTGISLKVTNLDEPSFLDGLHHEHILVCARDSQDMQWRRALREPGRGSLRRISGQRLDPPRRDRRNGHHPRIDQYQA